MLSLFLCVLPVVFGSPALEADSIPITYTPYTDDTCLNAAPDPPLEGYWEAMTFPLYLHDCMLDPVCGNYLIISCASGGQLEEICYTDSTCTVQKSCFGPSGDTAPFMYDNTACTTEFKDAPYYNVESEWQLSNPYKPLPLLDYYKFTWDPNDYDAVCNPGSGGSGSGSDEATSEYTGTQLFDVIGSTYTVEQIVYRGLAAIGFLSIVGGLYKAFQKSYEVIPSEEDQV